MGFGGYSIISRIERTATNSQTLIHMIGHSGEFYLKAEDVDDMIKNGVLEIVEDSPEERMERMKSLMKPEGIRLEGLKSGYTGAQAAEGLPSAIPPKITITGNAGSGKTTLARQVSQALRGLGFQCIVSDPDIDQPDPIQTEKAEWLAKKSARQQIVIETQQSPRPSFKGMPHRQEMSESVPHWLKVRLTEITNLDHEEDQSEALADLMKEYELEVSE